MPNIDLNAAIRAAHAKGLTPEISAAMAEAGIDISNLGVITASSGATPICDWAGCKADAVVAYTDSGQLCCPNIEHVVRAEGIVREVHVTVEGTFKADVVTRILDVGTSKVTFAAILITLWCTDPTWVNAAAYTASLLFVAGAEYLASHAVKAAADRRASK